MITDLLDVMRFSTHARGKSARDRNVIENNFNKTALLASGLRGSKSQQYFPSKKSK